MFWGKRMSIAVQGDNRERIFEELIDRHLPMIRRVVFRILYNAMDTDDVIQQAMLKAWEKFEYCNDPDKLSGWVCRIASNEAYDLLRRRKRESVLFEDFPAADSAIHHRPEITEAVEKAVKNLPEHLHSALNLTVFEEFSTSQAAATLGCTPSTIYWRVFKARKILEKQLKELLS